jgi:hypothetical protein
VPIYSEDDRRRLVPQVLVQVLTCLMDETVADVPSAVRAELRSLRTRVCKLYKLPDPSGPANASDVAQMMEEADGLPIEE